MHTELILPKGCKPAPICQPECFPFPDAPWNAHYCSMAHQIGYKQWSGTREQIRQLVGHLPLLSISCFSSTTLRPKQQNIGRKEKHFQRTSAPKNLYTFFLFIKKEKEASFENLPVVIKLEMLGSIVSRLAHYDACANLSTLCKHGFFLARNIVVKYKCLL